jgi:hypothetical protein
LGQHILGILDNAASLWEPTSKGDLSPGADILDPMAIGCVGFYAARVKVGVRGFMHECRKAISVGLGIGLSRVSLYLMLMTLAALV